MQVTSHRLPRNNLHLMSVQRNDFLHVGWAKVFEPIYTCIHYTCIHYKFHTDERKYQSSFEHIKHLILWPNYHNIKTYIPSKKKQKMWAISIHGCTQSGLIYPVRSTFAVRETASLGHQMLNAPVGINGLRNITSNRVCYYTIIYVNCCIWTLIHANSYILTFIYANSYVLTFTKCTRYERKSSSL